MNTVMKQKILITVNHKDETEEDFDYSEYSDEQKKILITGIQ